MTEEYNHLADRLSAGEFLDLQEALETILRLTIGSMEGPTRTPCEASVRFHIEDGVKLPLAARIRSLD